MQLHGSGAYRCQQRLHGKLLWDISTTKMFIITNETYIVKLSTKITFDILNLQETTNNQRNYICKTNVYCILYVLGRLLLNFGKWHSIRWSDLRCLWSHCLKLITWSCLWGTLYSYAEKYVTLKETAKDAFAKFNWWFHSFFYSQNFKYMVQG